MAAENSGISFSFRYKERLHRDREFKKIFKHGRRANHPAILIYLYERPDKTETKRLGLVVSRKLGIAVKRNRAKRRLREIFRLNKHLMKPGIDIIFLPRQPIVRLPFNDIKETVLGLLKKLGAFI